MKNHSFQKGINDIKQIKMTHAEKQAMLSRITTAQVIESPWSVYSFSIWIKKHSWSYAVMAVVVIFAVGGGFGSAVRGTLPGDLLYPLKVTILEPLKGVLTVTTPVAEAEYQSSLATERLQEAETLATQGKLDQPRQQIVDVLLKQHTEAFNVATASTSEMKIKKEFQATLKAHAKLLDAISMQVDTSNKDSIKDLANVTRGHAEALLTAATSTATSTKDKASFKKHEKDVELIINDTHSVLSTMGSTTDSLSQTIASTTIEGLDQAQESLRAADEHSAQGDQDSADQSLKQSERSATETHIFLNAGINLQKERRRDR